MARASVRLAVWLSERGYQRLYRLVHVYWRIRNVFLDWYEPKATKIWMFLAPKCPEHPTMPMTHGICGRCVLDRTIQRVRLDRLAGRK